jgi:hypothetical protein
MGFSAEEMTEVFMEADKNFDGQLSFKEFKEGILPILSERMGLAPTLQAAADCVAVPSEAAPAWDEAVPFTLALDMDLSSLGNKEAFKRDVIKDVASAAKIDAKHVKVTALRAGSVIVDMLIAKEAGDAKEIVRNLEEQLTSPNSLLMQGKLTRKAKKGFPKEAEALALTLFAMFDLDNSGSLSTAEAEQCLCSMGFSAEEMTEVFMEADKNFDGQLSFKEFKEGILPILSERMGICLDSIPSSPIYLFLFLLLNLRCISVYLFFFPFSHTHSFPAGVGGAEIHAKPTEKKKEDITPAAAEKKKEGNTLAAKPAEKEEENMPAAAEKEESTPAGKPAESHSSR